METESPAISQSAPIDAVLIAAARRGETASFRVLVGRHQAAGARLARRLAPAAHMELLQAAISSVHAGLRSGAGPRVAFRPHLLTAVRRAALESKKGRNRGEQADATAFGIDPALLAIATRAYRGLPESQQVALWHTEVDGDPLLDTGVLLGVSGTEIAELAFAGREGLRHALLESHLEKISAGPCQWTTDRLGAHVRGRLNPAVNEKVAAHLGGCTGCAAALPAVKLVETELQALVATIVLGPAAAPYLGQEIPRQSRKPVAAVTLLAAGPAFLVSHAKAAAFVGLGAVLVTGGLVGGLNFIDTGETPSAVSGPFTIEPTQSQSPDRSTSSVDVVADSGSGVVDGSRAAGDTATAGPATTGDTASTGGTASGNPGQPTPAATTAPKAAAAARPRTGDVAGPTIPRTTHPSAPTGNKPKRNAPTLHLGFTDVSITPGKGFLWLFSFSD